MRYWILIADPAGAKLFSKEGPSAALKFERDIENPRGRARPQELLADDPGRYAKGGKHGVLSAMEPRTPVHKAEEIRFAHHLAELLEVGRAKKQYEVVAMFAPPEFLGILRKEISPAVSKALLISVAKDLCHIDPHDLPKHVESALPPLPN
jgi:protein required for attachment to host cells